MKYHPSREEFCELAREGDLVPVYREVPADLETPVSAFCKLRGQGYCFLLESVEKGEQVGRYSFIGTDLPLLLRVAGEAVSRADHPDEPLAGRNPLRLLREALAGHRVAQVPGLPAFWGGAVGFLAYDVARSFERLPDRKRPGLGLPEAMFVLTDQVVVFDHVKQKMQVVALVRVQSTADVDAAYDTARARIDRRIAALAAPVRAPAGAGRDGPAPRLESNVTPEDFLAAVRRAQEHIRAGDAFQVVLSQRLSRRTTAHPVAIYRALRMLNPSPYMFFLDFQDFQLIGSSPEMLVKLEDGTAETRPIAGTRRRGASDEEDRRLAAELLADPKERAEHVMLVDLGRNDLGRVCTYGSVRVPALMEIERYSHVMHIVSSVKGILDGRRDVFDLVQACFPAGTLSGAPKIRAMEIIEDLEPTRRGPYGGMVGYFGFQGSVNTCITIRTIVMRGDEVFLQAGAGIVADSEPEREYQETLEKLAALRQAVDLAEEGLE